MRIGQMVLSVALSTGALSAQSASFVVTLGSDTVQVERFGRTGNRVEGTVVTRSPTTRVARWTADLDTLGLLTRYEVQTAAADGGRLAGVAERVTLTWVGDSLVRDVVVGDVHSQQRFLAPAGTVPGPSLPYLGVSYVMYEIGLRAARSQSPDSVGTRRLSQVTVIPRQVNPSSTRVWLVGADSAEVDYFGVARSGWKMSGDGALLRADWGRTTYRYQIHRTAVIDVDAVARAWSAADARGRGMGALSPRDTTTGTVGDVATMIEYSRPARRGRTVWGEVVPWGVVWRLGADMATHLTVSGPVMIGGALVPAGSYTLWMLPDRSGSSLLIINKRTRIFGTQYDAREDLVRVPLQRTDLSVPVERLTLVVGEGQLQIRWGATAYTVAVAPGPPSGS